MNSNFLNLRGPTTSVPYIAVGLVGIVFFYFMFVHRSFLFRFYLHVLAPLAVIGMILFSHAGLRDQLNWLEKSSIDHSFFLPILFLVALLLVALYAIWLCGVQYTRLWPLFILMVPLVLHKLRSIFVVSPDEIMTLCLFEYGVYIGVCLFLIPALLQGIEHFKSYLVPRVQPVSDNEAKEGCHNCFRSSAVFGVLILVFYMAFSLIDNARYPTAPTNNSSSPHGHKLEPLVIGMLKLTTISYIN